MIMLIRPMRRLGVAIDPKVLGRMEPVRGDIFIVIHEGRGSAMRRTTRVASIAKAVPSSPDLLPNLLDVTISTMVNSGFVLSGIEMIGDAAYAQSWKCEVPEEHAKR